MTVPLVSTRMEARMKITDITTTALHLPEITTHQDATMRRPARGQSMLSSTSRPTRATRAWA